MSSNCFVFHTSGGISSSLAALVFNFSQNLVEFFLSERSEFNVRLFTNNSGHWFMCNFRLVS